MNELHHLGVAELAAAIADKKTSSVEVAQHLLARAKQHAGLGAYLAFNEDATLAQARAADARIAAGERTPLLGVPLAHHFARFDDQPLAALVGRRMRDAQMDQSRFLDAGDDFELAGDARTQFGEAVEIRHARHAQQQTLSCVTVKHQPPKSNEDFHVAALLASHLALPHIALKQSLSYLSAELCKNRLTSYCALEHSWFLPLYNYLKDSATPFVFDGIGGDVLSTGSSRLTAARLALARAGRWEALAEDLLGPEGYLRQMLAPSLFDKLSRAQAVADMSQALAQYADSANPIAQFYFWNRARRTIGSSAFGILGRVSTPLAPFLDQALYQLLSAVPAEYFLQQGPKQLHDQLIANCYPQSAGIRYEDKSVADNHSYLTTRIAQNLQQLGYLSWHKPAGLKMAPLLLRLPKRIVNAQFHYSSAALVRTALYLHTLEQITDHGFI